MKDEICINLRALTQKQRNKISTILREVVIDTGDIDAEIALETLKEFYD